MQLGVNFGEDLTKSSPQKKPDSKDTNSQKSENKKSENKKSENKKSEILNEGDDGDSTSTVQSNKSKIILALIAVAVVVTTVVVIFIYKKTKESSINENVTSDFVQDDGNDMSSTSVTDYNEDQEESSVGQPMYDDQGNMVYDESGNAVGENSINVGTVPFSESDNFTTTDNVVDADEYIKDINGASVLKEYTVETIDYIEDYANYTAKRGIIDDGMEMYWIDIDYKGKKYRAQCSFNYFRGLEPSGICKVKIEVLTLQGGGKIISDMYLMD